MEFHIAIFFLVYNVNRADALSYYFVFILAWTTVNLMRMSNIYDTMY